MNSGHDCLFIYLFILFPSFATIKFVILLVMLIVTLTMFGRVLLQIVFNFNLKMLTAMFEYRVFVKCIIILLFSSS